MNGFGKHKGKKQLLWYSTQSLRRRTQEQDSSKVSGAWFLCGWTGNTIESPLHASLLLSSHCVVVIFKGHGSTGNRKGASLFCSTLKEFMKRYISTNYGLLLRKENVFFSEWKENRHWSLFLQGVLVKVVPYRMDWLYILSSSTVFENHRKSLIQYWERSELRLHFEWTKAN